MNRLDQHQKSLDFCTYCPKLCSFACPVSNAEHRETVTPWAKMTLARQLREGFVSVDQASTDPLNHCLGCRLCTTYCKHKIEVGEALTQARAWLNDRNVIRPEFKKLRDTFMATGNPYGGDVASVLHEMLPAERFAREAEVVFFPGCATALKRPGEIGRVFSILDKLRVDFVACYEGPEWCCGLPLRHAGLMQDFENHLRRLAQRLMDHKLVLTSCPACTYTLKVLAPEIGINLSGRVMHVVEFLEPYLKNQVFSHRLEKAAVYHDASYMGRYLGITRSPKAILERLYDETPKEFVWNGASAYPSGSTGIYPLLFPEESKAIARERLRQAREVGAEVIVTTSPAAASALESAAAVGDPESRTLIEQIDKCLE